MPIDREIKGRFGPLDFNDLIERKIPFFDEEGHQKDMHLILAANRGLKIAEALDLRVKEFFQNFENQPPEESSIERGNLLAQFQRLREFVKVIDETLSIFNEKINNYDSRDEQAMTEPHPIMNEKDVYFTKANLVKIKREIFNLYLNERSLPSITTLVDRIKELKELVI